MLENENGNGKRTATVYDTYLRDKKRARFNIKKRGIPFCATYSPDGRTLFVATDRGIFPADPRTLETGECLERTGSIPDMLLVSPNGYFLLAIAGDRCAVYNLEEGKVRKTLLTGQRITDAMFSPDSREMVLLSDDGMASVYNMNTLTVRKMIDGLGQARAGALNFDGKYLAVADRPDNIVLVNTLRDTDRTNIHVPDGDIRDLGFIYDAGRNTLMVYPVPGAVKARRMPLLKPYYNKLIDEEVNARMEEWLKMQPGETMEQYASRVTDETRAEQRRMFEYEITTRLAGNLIAGQPVGIGEYNRANGMLALKPGDMPQIFINVPEEEATAFSDPALVSLSEVLYGVMDDDTFEIVYARVTNGVNGKSYIFDNRNRKPLDYMKGGRRNLAPGAPAAEDGGGAAARTQRARRQRGQEHERNLRPYQHLGGLARGGRLRRQRAPHPQLRGELHLRRRPGLLGAGRLPLRQVPRGAVGRRLPAVVSAGMPESVAYDDRQPTRGNAAKTPGFNEFATPLVQRRFADWAKRREFEELRDYDRRMNEQGYDEYRRLCDEAAEEYIGIYGGRLRLSDLTLHPYDVDDETYLITSGMGPVVVSVPKKKKEAEAFKASWPTMKFRNPRFIVKDDRVRIASVTLETSYGKSYPYSMENLATYRCPDVAVDFRSIIDRSKALEGNTAQGVPSVRQNTAVVRAKSSVDENIPVTKRVNEHTIAVVWANENYDGDVERVSGAINDGETFARYLTSSFGIPQDKVRLVTDATAGQMKRSLKWLRGPKTPGTTRRRTTAPSPTSCCANSRRAKATRRWANSPTTCATTWRKPICACAPCAKART